MSPVRSEDDMDLDAELELVQSDAALARFAALPCEKFGGLSDRSPRLLLGVLRRYYETQTGPLEDPWPGRLYAHLMSRPPCPSHAGPALLAWLRATPDWLRRQEAMRWTASAARRAGDRLKVAILSATADYFFAVVLYQRASLEQVDAACGYFNVALSDANRSFLKSLGETHNRRVTSVAKLMMSCGDFSTQMTLLENIFYFSDDPRTEGRVDRASVWFPRPEHSNVRKMFCELSFADFDQDCRLFLNAVNQISSKVISVKCTKIAIGDLIVFNCEETNSNGGCCVDLNQGSDTLSWYCRREYFVSRQNANVESELIRVKVNTIENSHLSRNGDNFRLTLFLSAPPSAQSAPANLKLQSVERTISLEFCEKELANIRKSHLHPKIIKSDCRVPNASNIPLLSKLKMNKFFKPSVSFKTKFNKLTRIVKKPKIRKQSSTGTIPSNKPKIPIKISSVTLGFSTPKNSSDVPDLDPLMSNCRKIVKLASKNDYDNTIFEKNSNVADKSLHFTSVEMNDCISDSDESRCNLSKQSKKDKENIPSKKVNIPENVNETIPLKPIEMDSLKNVQEIREYYPAKFQSLNAPKGNSFQNDKADPFSVDGISEQDQSSKQSTSLANYSYIKNKKSKQSKITNKAVKKSSEYIYNPSRILPSTVESTRKSVRITKKVRYSEITSEETTSEDEFKIKKSSISTPSSGGANKRSPVKSGPKKNAKNVSLKGNMPTFETSDSIQNINLAREKNVCDSMQKNDLCNKGQSMIHEHNVEHTKIMDKFNNLYVCCNKKSLEQMSFMNQYVSDINAIHQKMLSDIEKSNAKLAKNINVIFNNNKNNMGSLNA